LASNNYRHTTHHTHHRLTVNFVQTLDITRRVGHDGVRKAWGERERMSEIGMGTREHDCTLCHMLFLVLYEAFSLMVHDYEERCLALGNFLLVNKKYKTCFLREKVKLAKAKKSYKYKGKTYCSTENLNHRSLDFCLKIRQEFN
jgi:hypothetical protein